MVFLPEKAKQAKERVAKAFRQLASKGPKYWVIVAFLVPLGVIASHEIGERRILITPRYHMYSWMQRKLVHHPNYYSRTAVVLIGDDEFWRGDELARRTPLKRTYLAKLLRKLDLAGPAVIAIDIDLRSQTVDRSVMVHSDYYAETDCLLNTISAVAINRPVVLPRSLISGTSREEPSLLAKEKQYLTEQMVFDGYFRGEANVRSGYVTLPYDIRQVPLGLRLKNGELLDSFAAETARALDSRAVSELQESGDDALPYGIFISEVSPPPLRAHAVLDLDLETLRSKVEHKAVIIGAGWHANAYGRGALVDSHITPVGEISGVLVQANYVEALATHWTFKPLGERLSLAIEVMLSLFIAVVFAWKMGGWKKLFWAVGLSGGLVIGSYVAWQNVGLFFDFFIPLILLGSHTVLDEVIEWRDDAKKYKALMKKTHMKELDER